jgi:inosose dehydratase
MEAALHVANSPVSYGAFELTVGLLPGVPDGIRVLDDVSSAGYQGIDLGPPGYLGKGNELAERLAARNLALAGAFLELPLLDATALRASLVELDAIFETLDAVTSLDLGPAPRLALAVNGNAERQRHPGEAAHRADLALGQDSWKRLGAGLNEVVDRCLARGYEPTFHPETSSFVESAAEIERLLNVSDIGLCLDTGHLLLAGTDPVKAAKAWGTRINHVHLKDADVSVLREILNDGGGVEDIWLRDTFTPLGHGDLDIAGVLTSLREVKYGGWLVVEQEIMPSDDDRFRQASEDQQANRRLLAQFGV